MPQSNLLLAPLYQRPDICGRVEEVSPSVFETDFLPVEHCQRCGLRCRDVIHHCAIRPEIPGSNWQWYCTQCFAREGKQIGHGVGHRYRLRPF